MSRPLRVLHVPDNVGGQPQSIAVAERALGLDSRVVTLHPTRFGYPADEVLFAPGAGRLDRFARRLGLLRRLAWWADIVHFNFGSTSFMRPPSLHDEAHVRSARPLLRRALGLRRAARRELDHADLCLLRSLGKGIVVTYQGDDARQGDECRRRFRIHPADEAGPGYYTPTGDAERRRRIQIFDRYADRIYALNPDLLHVLPGRAAFLPYGNIDVRTLRPEPRPRRERPTIVHAPSHRGVKGTRFLLEAVRRLRDEDRLDVDLVLVESRAHAEALQLYRSADVLVDQLLCGWYGGLSVEVMAMGVPSICYIREEDLAFVPTAMRTELPIIRAEPDTVRDVLREWLTTRRAELPARGAESRRFVERWHDPRAVATRLRADYEAIARRS